MRIGSKLLWFLNTGLRSAPQYSRFLPGQTAPQLTPALYRSTPSPGAALRPAAGLMRITAAQAISRGLMFAGNPDTVHRQILEFQAKAGKFDHLVLASRSGFMTHEEATRGLKLFAREVLPRFRERS